MARKTKKRYYRSKGRWSANIATLTNQTISAPPGTFYSTYDLTTNPAQSNSTVSQQYTVKNIEISFEMDVPSDISTMQAIEGLTTYIMYVPQGMVVTETYPNNHPEYIMAYRFLGSPNWEGGASSPQNIGRNPLKIRTRLARRLQTGDKVILLVVGNNNTSSGNTFSVYYHGIVRWWTKAN